MLGHRELTTRDYVDIFKRRFWLMLVCVVVCLGTAIALTYWIAPRYTSQTLVLIEQQRVPTDYVTPILTEDLGERLASLREQILSRTRLEPIIQRFNLFAGKGADMDSRVAATRTAIQVKPVTAGARAGFYITFEFSDPHTAQQVCGEITSMFVSENLDAREQTAEGTTEFLKQQLADAKANLDAQDAKLAEFESKYLGRLPDQQSSNEGTLEALTRQLDASTQSLERLGENETFIEANIAAIKRDVHDAGSDTGGNPVSPSEQLKELQALEAQKKSLEAQYTPDYPDVREVNRRISELRAAMAHAPTAAAAAAKPAAANSSSESPQLAQSLAQLKAVQRAIVVGKQEQDKIKQQIQSYESRIESSPIVEEEYKKVTRDHDIALEFYNSLLKKMNESSMAMALEQRQEGEQFRVMDPPNLPDSPSFPSRPKFAAAGLAAGLALGLLIAALLEYRDTTLRTELDVWAFTKLPTLAVLSHVNDVPTLARDAEGKADFAGAAAPAESARG